MPESQSLFDGPGLDPEVDDPRLLKQIERVYRCMSDQRWWTLRTLAIAADAPEASVSARIRDLRKPWWGGHTVNERRRRERTLDAKTTGTHEYKLIPAPCGLLDGTQDPHDTVVWRQMPDMVWCVEHKYFHAAMPRVLSNVLIPTDTQECRESAWRPVRVKCAGSELA